MTAVSFSNTANAFADKTDQELLRAERLFSLMNLPSLVEIGAFMAPFALRLGAPVEYLIKKTIFPQFCGGETLEDVRPIIRKLRRSGIECILDYGVESKRMEADFEQTTVRLVQTLECARGDRDFSIISAKFSSLFRGELLERFSSGQALSHEERQEWQRGLARVDRICRAAYDAGLSLHIDAEESWIQRAIDEVAWTMSRRYNNGHPTIINAVQLYRKDRLSFLHESLEHAREHHYLCAVKLVRGAYMEKERKRSALLGYPSPIHESAAETDRAFLEGLSFCIQNLGPMYVCNATHNESSLRFQMEKMEERGLQPEHPLIVTAQLYGMSDHLSFNMAAAGYQVQKYLPYGPVREVLPYLIRRTRENTAIGGQMGRELELIRRELIRRGLRRGRN